MGDNWMIFYKLIDGEYHPERYGKNQVPDENYDKVIQVPPEIAMQARKFNFDGNQLKRKTGELILTLEQLREREFQEDKLNGGIMQRPEEKRKGDNEEIQIIM